MKKPSYILSEKTLEAIQLRVEGLTYREIGEKLNYTVQGAATQVNRGLLCLRKNGAAALSECSAKLRHTPEQLIHFACQPRKGYQARPARLKTFTVRVIQTRCAYVEIVAATAAQAQKSAEKTYICDGKELPEMDEETLRFCVLCENP